MRKTILFFAACLFSFSTHASEPDPNWLPTELGAGYGVQIKEWRTGEEDLARMQAAGLSYVRFVIPWYAVEKGKGSFVWTNFDPIIELLREQGMKAVIVLGAGHEVYTPKLEAKEEGDYELAAPRTPEEIEAFSRYAAKTVERYGTDGIIWEIWNEPDSPQFWKPKPNAQDYARLAGAACRAIRAVAPKARVVGTGSAEMPGAYGTFWPGFVGKVLRDPDFACLDGLSFHAYRDGAVPPETVLEAYKKLRVFLKRFGPKGRVALPLLVTEWGFSLADVSAEEQAAFVVRSFLLNSLSGAGLSIWYEWRDSRLGEDNEAHYGLLDYHGKEKPSYKALRDFLLPLRGAKIEERLAIGEKDVFVLRLRKPDGSCALVGWSVQQDAAYRLWVESGLSGEGREYPLTFMPRSFECGMGALAIRKGNAS